MSKRIPARELIRLAMYYAENDRRHFAECNAPGSPERAEALSEAEQFMKYRIKYFGRVKLDAELHAAYLIDARTGERITARRKDVLKGK